MNNSNLRNGKGANLCALSTINGIIVPDFIEATEQDFDNSARIISFLEGIIAQYGKDVTVAVRSNTSHEDSHDASFAGMFQTILNVQPTINAVHEAMRYIASHAEEKYSVLKSYKPDIEIESIAINFVIQVMIHPDISGVIFSHSLSQKDSYYVISHHRNASGENIVSGKNNGELLRVHRDITTKDLIPYEVSGLISAMRKIEDFFSSISLDVEFGIVKNQVYILQCRAMTTTHSAPEKYCAKDDLACLQKNLHTFIADDFFGDMLDINPRELLGDSPENIDIAVFRYLFSDSTVEIVRRTLGYDPLDKGLLRIVNGKPYASLISSAFSLRPRGISENTYNKIVAVYKDMLEENPELQSSVEFDVFAMSNDSHLSFIADKAKLNSMEKAEVYKAFTDIDTSILEVSQNYQKMIWGLMDDYEKSVFGTQPADIQEALSLALRGTKLFVLVARLAFYWKNFCDNTPGLQGAYLTGLRSIPSELQDDLRLVLSGKLSTKDVIAKYGHLKPGQFRVFGESYRDDPERYLFSHNSVLQPEERISSLEYTALEESSVLYARTFLYGREKVKFLFTKAIDNLSHILQQYSPQELSAFVKSIITDRNELSYPLSHHAILPETLSKKSNLGMIISSSARPTYITSRVVSAPIIILKSTEDVPEPGSIVVLPQADPGYDYIFSYGIVGLITRSGGPASHMTIRTTEMSIPSCIGCGESTYNMLLNRKNSIVTLDCSSKEIRID